MKTPNFERLLKKHNVHSTFLNDSSIIEALKESYELGRSYSEKENKLLKSTFESLLYEYAHNGKHNKSINLITDEWERKAGI